jgi:hypothetical protein
MLDQMASRGTDHLVNYVLSGSKSGGARLEQVASLLEPEDWNAFRGAYFRELGTNPKTGEFSPTRLRGAVNELTPKARATLFGAQMDDVADLSSIAEEMARVDALANQSRTAITASNFGLADLGAGGTLGTVGTMVGGPVGGAIGGVTGAAARPIINNTLTRFATSPKFAPWVASEINFGGGPVSGAVGRSVITPLDDNAGDLLELEAQRTEMTGAPDSRRAMIEEVMVKYGLSYEQAELLLEGLGSQ